MSSEESKGTQVEIPIFLEFINSGSLALDPDSVQKREPPEPDLLCRSTTGEVVAFELVEICDANLAKNKEEDAYIRTSDPSFDIVKSKLGKRYVTDAPIELLCYTNGRVVSPDHSIAAQIIPLISVTEFQYRRIWLFGQRGVQLLWERS